MNKNINKKSAQKSVRSFEHSQVLLKHEEREREFEHSMNFKKWKMTI